MKVGCIVGSLLFVYVGHGAGGDYGEPALLTVGATVEDPSGSGLSLERLAAALVPRPGGWLGVERSRGLTLLATDLQAIPFCITFAREKQCGSLALMLY